MKRDIRKNALFELDQNKNWDERGNNILGILSFCLVCMPLCWVQGLQSKSQMSIKPLVAQNGQVALLRIHSGHKSLKKVFTFRISTQKLTLKYHSMNIFNRSYYCLGMGT